MTSALVSPPLGSAHWSRDFEGHQGHRSILELSVLLILRTIMAALNKLSIRGVRSFSPDDSEQVVEFFFPVTMIVGANGCGSKSETTHLEDSLPR